MGGEGSNRVFGQTEAYDPARDAWEAYAPMPTPRHGLGAVTLGRLHPRRGGGPVMGGGVQSAVHERSRWGEGARPPIRRHRALQAHAGAVPLCAAEGRVYP
jgi:hypothetical protein